MERCNNCGGEFELAMGVVPILRCTNLTCQRELPATALPKESDIHVLTKSITFTDLNGDTQTETHSFHLSKADLVQIEVEKKGGMEQYLKEIVAAENNAEIFALFKKIILLAYGKRSDDGKRFIKNEELRQDFLSSEAYSALIMEMIEDADAAAQFVNGVVPGGIQVATPVVEETPTPEVAATPAEVPEQPTKVLSRAEAFSMPSDELALRIATGWIISDN